MSELDDLLEQTVAEFAEEGYDSDDDKSLEGDADSGPDDESGELEDDGDPSADDADEGEDEPVDDEGEDEESEPEPEPEPEPSPNAVLLHELAELRRQVASLQQERAVQSERQRAPDPNLREAVRILAYGGDEKQLLEAGIPRSVHAEAARLVAARHERLVDEILDPAHVFQHMAPLVEQTARKIVSPVQQQLAERWATETVERLTNGMSADDRRRVGQIMETLPGKGIDSELVPRLELAVRLFKSERSTATIEKQKQKVKAAQRQDRAIRRERRGSGKPRSRRGAPPPVPDLEPGEDLEAYERRVQDYFRQNK